MPLSRHQIDNILDVDGKPMIAPGRMDHNLSARVAESWVRRRLFAHEDSTVIQQFDLYKSAYQDLRAAGSRLGEAFGVDDLAPNGAAMDWRRNFLATASDRMRQLSDQVALEAYAASQTAYLASYFGRAWLLQSMTLDNVQVNAPVPNMDTVRRNLLQRPLLEQVEEDLLWQLLGREWREAYDNELGTLLIKMRRSLNGSMAQGHSIPQAMRDLRDVLGVSTDRRSGYRANFNRVQTITRSYIIDASNQGALDLYQANSNVVVGIEWLAANDSRVCPICLGYDGNVYDVDDPNIPRPVRDTHPQCRCTYTPVIDETMAIAPDIPPRLSFIDYVILLGIERLLRDFITGRRLETDRVGFTSGALDDAA